MPSNTGMVRGATVAAGFGVVLMNQLKEQRQKQIEEEAEQERARARQRFADLTEEKTKEREDDGFLG